jgi:hypothetical protein
VRAAASCPAAGGRVKLSPGVRRRGAATADRNAREPLSHQLESVHYLRTGDEVRHADGRTGRVEEALTLYAVVGWDDGRREEVDQLDPRIVVVERASRD